jgi:5-methylcytosine-specific restriction endonuclease McrA
MKECQSCKENKPLTNFYKSKTCTDGYSVICKSCHLIKYYTPTPNKKECRVCSIKIDNSNGMNSGHKRKDGSIIYQSICKTCYKPQRNLYHKQKRDEDPLFKLYGNIRSRINVFFKSNSIKTLDILGCNLNFYKTYLECKFDDNMTWENYGEYWEIDHIIPVSKGGSFNYINTQPLPVTENRKKSNKL